MGTLKPSHIQRKQLLKIEALTSDQLNNILFDDYSAIRPQISDQYSSQTMKCHHSALNRYFKKEKGIDIAKDSQFVKTHEMFKAILVEAKRKGCNQAHTNNINN